MVESEYVEYNLNANQGKQSLKLSLINNQQICIALVNQEEDLTYKVLLTLQQLKKLCKAFTSTKTIKEALTTIKKAIESRKIMLDEAPKGDSIEINFKILSKSKEYSFDINLLLLKKSEEIQEKENEVKYSSQSTTEYSKPMIDSNVKPPIMQIEYIEPILQVHFPDGTTQTKVLSPRIQGNYKISEEQFRMIREQMNRNMNNSPLKGNLNHRSNSATKGKRSPYSVRTTKNNNQLNNFQNINQTNKVYNNMNYKTVSDYSTMTVKNRPFVVSNSNYGFKGPNPTLKNNGLNTTNILQNKIKMINKINQNHENRSSSTPSHPNYKSKSLNIYQPNLTNNPFQINVSYNQNIINNTFNNRIKIPFDRNTEKRTIKNNGQDPQDKQSLRSKPNPQKTQQTKVQNQQTTKNIKKKGGPKNNQIKSKKNHKIKQVQSYTNQRVITNPDLGHKSSHEINQVRTQIFSQPQNSQFRSKISTPLPNTTPSYNQISEQQIALAQYASMQNQENPNFKNLKAITLEGKEEIQIGQQQQQYEKPEEDEERNMEEEQIQEKEEDVLNIEALFITEEGRVIFRNGLLRGIIHRYAEIDDVVSKIQDLLLKGVKFHLVYKAFDLDDKAKTFHEKCDNLNMSLVLVETQKDVRFGGFTTKSWKGNCLKKKDNRAFVFSLETNKIFDVIENEPAMGCYPKFGPVFFGCQIRIYDEFFSKGGSTCHKGLNYKTKKDFELNNGEQTYLVKDIEVYSIETVEID